MHCGRKSCVQEPTQVFRPGSLERDKVIARERDRPDSLVAYPLSRVTGILYRSSPIAIHDFRFPISDLLLFAGCP